ncbi:DUF2834 domain-containing protein [Oceanicola sp. S124]|uniref:DUF2834 domain-containing protein n=1 Tax=Oceanicola sp. S124 TaxID=1042378 RepID=UPI000255A42B|nr:DUF2834 domain-containing protein [Oceanicola sp. S124]
MAPLRILFLALAVWGSLHPLALIFQWFAENGISLTGLIAAWRSGWASSALFWDLVISAIALTAWVLAECLPRRDRIGLLAIPATFCIGVSCGLPLYLFLRSRRV